VPLADIERVVSIPVATAQCRGFLARELPGVEQVAANSTAEAARWSPRSADGRSAAIGRRWPAKVYGLEVLAADIEDHPSNQTRFVWWPARHARAHRPRQDHHRGVPAGRPPGSLLAILQEFAARAINLTKLESRPTKRGLGDYCFIIDLEGHVADELVADCLRDLKSKQADVKFLGSYPAAGEHGPPVRREAPPSPLRAYQFHRGTWDNVARQHFPKYVGVDPARAEPKVQDAMTRALWSMTGPRSWPVCGYRV
jgi:prephenate dehydratase